MISFSSVFCLHSFSLGISLGFSLGFSLEFSFKFPFEIDGIFTTDSSSHAIKFNKSNSSCFSLGIASSLFFPFLTPFRLIVFFVVFAVFEFFVSFAIAFPEERVDVVWREMGYSIHSSIPIQWLCNKRMVIREVVEGKAIEKVTSW